MNTLEPKDSSELPHQTPPARMSGLQRAERRAMEHHRFAMEAQSGSPVSMEEAETDWRTNHAQTWRQAWHRDCMEAQKAEILKHKWIESEKAHQDLGNKAIVDWISKYAGQWRVWYEESLV